MISQEEPTFDNIFNSKIEEIKSSFEEIRNNEFEIYNFKYIKPELVKKDINVDTVDFKNYQSAIRKKAMSEKNKPSNMFKNDIETTDNTNINIIDDPIFNSEDVEESSQEKIDISILDRETKLNLIHKKLEPKTINNYFTVIKGIFRKAIELNAVDTTPSFPKIKYKKPSAKKF